MDRTFGVGVAQAHTIPIFHAGWRPNVGPNRCAGQRAIESGFLLSEKSANVWRTASSRKANYRQQANAIWSALRSMPEVIRITSIHFLLDRRFRIPIRTESMLGAPMCAGQSSLALLKAELIP
jgi:hypothetical protein